MVRMGILGLSLIFIFAFVPWASGQAGNSQVPEFSDYSFLDGKTFPESLPVGSYIGTVKAYDPDGTEITYSISGKGAEYFEIDATTGRVILKKLLDYDTVQNQVNLLKLTLTLELTDATGQRETIDLVVYVDDANDLDPTFVNPAQFYEIYEGQMPGLVIALISVTDKDKTNEQLSVKCVGDTKNFRDACDKFRLEVNSYSNFNWEGNVTLDKSLDYETRKAFAIQLEAFDGVNKRTTEVHVEVLDINDTPPRWVIARDVRIDEELPDHEVFTRVKAIDQDTAVTRPIMYDLIGDHTNIFSINGTTGDISVISRIDFDEDNEQGALVYDLTVKASEVLNINPLVLGSDSTTTVTTVVAVTILDIDDNPPTFDQDPYIVNIKENIETRANIPGLQMTITDKDSGTFNSFDLIVLDHTDIFDVIPQKDAKSSSATLYIKNSELIDYESGTREYRVGVMARENLVFPPLSGTTTVIVTVKDVNDIVPTFERSSYQTTVDEDVDNGDTVVDIQASDKENGIFGTEGIRYTLFGDVDGHFQIDDITGVITTATCAGKDKHGEHPCIDYERKKSYGLTVSATDEKGIGQTRSIEVLIRVIDKNDNAPELALAYEASIFETLMTPVNPLIIDAEDPDTLGGPITYTLLGAPDVWKIENQGPPNARVGNITARRPIQYSDADDPSVSGEVFFRVKAEDQLNERIATVKITIIDINNNDPVFDQPDYEQFIPEDTTGRKFIQRVTATDGDAATTANGQLEFDIYSGAQGKFLVEPVPNAEGKWIADVYTTSDATFDFEKQKLYEMELEARDQGTPQTRTGISILRVHITDINNNAPKIDPPSSSIAVSENEPIDKMVHTVVATDPDEDKKLRYYFEAYSARNPSGEIVDKDKVDYTAMFRLEEKSGIVRVNSALNRDLTSSISYRLYAVDINGATPQTGTGALFITILEYNDQSPHFGQYPYDVTINEELNLDYFVENLRCSDPDDKISGYSIIQTIPSRLPEYFALNGNSGGLIINNRIDYEKLQYIELEATCVDTGIPRRSNTTKVHIKIRNLNDNSPEFDLPLYQATLLEKTPAGTYVTTVSATDIDLEDYGVVRYKLAPDSDSKPFRIDSIHGNISVADEIIFDRESRVSFSFQVIAYDSPLNDTFRRQTQVPVYVTIEDINDNCPIFRKPFYNGYIPESAPSGTDIVDIIADDKDSGLFGAIKFEILPGSGIPPEGEDYFAINPRSGRIITKDNLRKRSGVYLFNVTATDMNGLHASPPACVSEVQVLIEVNKSTNNPPLFIRPPRKDFVIYVLESQYEGMLVYNAKAVDSDPGPSGIVDYFFEVGDELVSKTAEFRINHITGVIRAEIEYDREQVDQYFLTLMAKDQGSPYATSRVTLTVIILDVDDNEPRFPMQDGVVVPLVLPEDGTILRENDDVGSGQKLGSCIATDLDSDHKNNQIFYELFAPSDKIMESISVDRDTCNISLIKRVDFELTPTLQFNIRAFNEESDDSVKRHKRSATLPNILPVVVNVVDVNDNPPVFAKSHYMACIYVDTPYLQPILAVEITDKDGSSPIEYSLQDTILFQIESNGVIKNIASFHSVSNTAHSFKVIAKNGDLRSSANVTIFVVGPNNQVRIKENRPRMDAFTMQAAARITEETPGIDFTCAKAADFINENGKPSDYSSELLVAAVRIDREKKPIEYQVYSSGELLSVLNGEGEYISIKEEDDNDEISFSEESVIIIFIICILLIIIALILLCLACYCIRDRKKKKTKAIKAQRSTVVQVAEEENSSFQNPVYYNHGFKPEEPEYATVKKNKPIAPVVIAAPQNLEPVDTQQPSELVPEPEPVIETEVLPSQEPESSRPDEPESEDVIETTVVEDELVSEPDLPPPADDEEIEVEIGDEPPELPPPSDEIEVEITDEPSFPVPPQDHEISGAKS